MRKYLLCIGCLFSCAFGLSSGALAQDSSSVIDAEFLGMGALYQINAHKAYELGITGKGVNIAVLDSGINYFHPELFSQIADGGFDFYQNRFDYMDYNGHGSLVSGVIGAARDGFGMHGVAYNSKILPLKVTSDDGEFYSHEAINWALYQAVQAEVDIINYSATYALDEGYTLDDGGITASTGFFYTAISDKAIVAAAGNTKNDNPLFPALLPYVKPENHDKGVYEFKSDIETDVSDLNWSMSENNIIAVVAADENGIISDFSNRCGVAAAWCITAPGEKITTTFWFDYYVSFDGTSLATPLVSGSLALLKELFPHLSNAQLIDLLLETANKEGIYADESIYGQGFLDVGAAISPQGILKLAGRDGLSTNALLRESSVTGGGAFGDSIQRGLHDRSTLISDDYARSYVVPLDGFAREGVANHLTQGEQMQFLRMANQAQHHQINNKASYMSFTSSNATETEGATAHAMFRYRHGNSVLSYRKGEATRFSDKPARSVDNLKNRLFRPAYSDMTTDGNAFDWQYNLNKNADITVSYREGGSLYNESLKAEGANIDLRLYGNNGVKLDLTYGFVNENESVLGMTGSGAFDFANNAHTDYIGGSIALPVLNNTTLIGSYYTGQTKASGSQAGLIENISTIKHRQAAIGIQQNNIWNENDHLNFVWEMPLRVTDGEIALDLYNPNNSNGVNIDLSPTATESNMHIFYDTPLPSMNGVLGVHATYSEDTSHVDNARNAAFLVHFTRTF